MTALFFDSARITSVGLVAAMKADSGCANRHRSSGIQKCVHEIPYRSSVIRGQTRDFLAERFCRGLAFDTYWILVRLYQTPVPSARLLLRLTAMHDIFKSFENKNSTPKVEMIRFSVSFSNLD